MRDVSAGEVDAKQNREGNKGEVSRAAKPLKTRAFPPAVPPCCTPSPEASDGPVRYNNGELLYSAVDLAAGGFGAPWGHTRLFSNRLDFSQDMGQGFNWLIDQWPYLVNEGDTIIMMKGLSERVWFDESGGGYYAGSAYTTRYGVHHKLEHDETNNIFKVKIQRESKCPFLQICSQRHLMRWRRVDITCKSCK